MTFLSPWWLLLLLPVIALASGAAVVAFAIRGAETLGALMLALAASVVPATLVAGVVLAGLVVVSVRLLGIGLHEGEFPVRSRIGWQVWSTERLLDLANARDADAFDRAIDLRIMRIRRKIELDPRHPAVIRTVRGGGYLFSPSGGEKA